jgi:hypothetical protein
MNYRFGWVNASYVYGLKLIDDTHMHRALGALASWETYKKATDGEFMLENPKLSEEADKTVRAAVRRASIIQAGSMTPQFKAPAAHQNGTSAVLDAHNGPNEASEHASG